MSFNSKNHVLETTEEQIRKILIDVACQKTTISYGQLNLEVPLHLDLNMTNDKAFLGHLLGIISKYEHFRNRPLLAALVTNKNGTQKNKPDKFFFTLAEKLGCYNSETEPVLWLESEQIRLFEEWETGVVKD